MCGVGHLSLLMFLRLCGVPLHFEKASVLVEKLVYHQADLINVAVSFLLSELFLLELPSNSFQ